MRQSNFNNSRRHLIGSIVATPGIFVAFGFATFSTLEALEERHAASVANELQVTTIDLSAAEALCAFAGRAPSRGFAPLVENLRSYPDNALHSLTDKAQARVEQLFGRIIELAIQDQPSENMSLTPIAWAELDGLLTSAPDQAAPDADAGRGHHDGLENALPDAQLIRLGGDEFAGISHVQGYLTGRPTPPGDLVERLESLSGENRLATSR